MPGMPKISQNDDQPVDPGVKQTEKQGETGRDLEMETLFDFFEEVPRFLDMETEHAPCWFYASRDHFVVHMEARHIRQKATPQQYRSVACQSRQEIIARGDLVCSAHEFCSFWAQTLEYEAEN